jgi:hypothetical protein
MESTSNYIKNGKGRPKGARNKKLSLASLEYLRPKLLYLIERLTKEAKKNKDDKDLAKWLIKELAPYSIKKVPIEQNLTVSGFEEFLSNTKVEKPKAVIPLVVDKPNEQPSVN